MNALLIGDLAERAGVPTPTIRYYESIGLLRPAARSAAGYRRYPERTVEELRFIKKAQALGFTLDEIGEILTLSRSGKAPCSQVLSLGHQHLAAVDERLRRLQVFREQLASELAKWEHKKNGVTCDGLCQFISDAAPEVTEVQLHRDAPPRRGSSPKAS
jgi:DNA-binding transcriptional MerR regulator